MLFLQRQAVQLMRDTPLIAILSEFVGLVFLLCGEKQVGHLTYILRACIKIVVTFFTRHSQFQI